METKLAVALLDRALSGHLAELVLRLARCYWCELQTASSFWQYSEDLIGPFYLDDVHQPDREPMIPTNHAIDSYMVGVDDTFRLVSRFRESKDVPQQDYER